MQRQRGSQIALPEHTHKTKSEAHPHGWSQGAQAGRELTELGEELKQDWKAWKGGVLMVKSADLKSEDT